MTNIHGVRRPPDSATSPCAACKLLRRRCAPDCVLAPYFPADEPNKFAKVHKVFGASNVSKMLKELAIEQRSDAVSSMVYEANARVMDPVYGSAGAIFSLQQQVDMLQTRLAMAQAEVVRLNMPRMAPNIAVSTASDGGMISSGGSSSGGDRSSPSSPSSSSEIMNMVSPDNNPLFDGHDGAHGRYNEGAAILRNMGIEALLWSC